MNFIEHTSDIGWKEYQRAKPVIIDPGLYSLQKSDVFWISEKRSVPTALKLFTVLSPHRCSPPLLFLPPLEGFQHNLPSPLPSSHPLVKTQKMRSSLEEKLMKRMTNVHRKAEVWRASAQMQHLQHLQKASENAQKLKSSYFTNNKPHLKQE